MKKTVFRFMNGFCFSMAITVLVHFTVLLITKKNPMLQDFVSRFDNPVSAYIVQLLSVGVMSGITSAGTVIFEAKRIGLVTQSVLFLIVLLSVWIPVSCVVWGFHKYTASMISTIASIVVTYGICWGIQYSHCKKDIEAINSALKKDESL